jgi:lipid A 3-O-deacylase
MKVPGVLLLAFTATLALAQENPVRKGATELGVFASGVIAVYPAISSDTRIFDAGARVGKVLTAEHGPGFLRGNFEFAVDLIPLYYVWNQDTSYYGGGFNPIVLKWNFKGNRNWAPYFEMALGTIFTTREITPDGSTANFLTQGGLGLHLFRRGRNAVTLSGRFFHISNARLGDKNPGIDGAHIMLGYTWFK